MNHQPSNQTSLEDFKINIKLKLAILWASFMFFYIYVDYFALYMPNKISDILKGKIFVFNISHTFLFGALASVSIPALMIFLSVSLPSKVNRILNIFIAALFIPYSLFNLTGEAWPHMILGASIEVILLCTIIYMSLKWPRSQIN
jgi:hypothetical protein